MNARARLILAAGLLAALGAAELPRPHPAAPHAAAPPVAVRTEPVVVGRVPLRVTANGLVQPVSVISVHARVDGEIEAVHVAEGAEVAAGDPLFTLDTRMTRATLDQLRANVDRDRVQLQQAEADAQRAANLANTGAGARQAADQARSQALALAATLRADLALVAQTEVTLSYAEIRAEGTGRLGAIALRAGNLVRAADGTVLTTITALSPIEVQFAVPEDLVDAVARALGTGSATVTAREAGSTRSPATGRLVFMDSHVDSATGTILLKAEFANEDRALWPGRYVGVVLTLGEEEGAITVPAAALRPGEAGSHVFVLGADGRAWSRPVTLRRTEGDRAVVSGQLVAGERVVTEGIQRLADGAPAVEATRQAGDAP